eukprot:21037-Heterococcus_DN1.PRE.2
MPYNLEPVCRQHGICRSAMLLNGALIPLLTCRSMDAGTTNARLIPFARRKVGEIPPAAIDRMLNVLHILKQLCCTFRVQSFVSDAAIQAFDLQHNDV